MAVTATITDVPEPYRVSVADRAYVSSASDSDDAVVAIDTTTGRALAATIVDETAAGIAVNPAGDVLYVGRNGDEVVDRDGDGLADSIEPMLGACVQTSTQGTDCDGDGLSDLDEVEGWIVGRPDPAASGSPCSESPTDPSPGPDGPRPIWASAA